MATLNAEYNQHVRAAITGTSFETTDPTKVGEWTTDGDKALDEAGKLLNHYGRTVNISVQQRVMFDAQAGELNAKRADQLETVG